jgi:hypothetical protein
MSSVELHGKQSDRPAAGNGLEDEVEARLYELVPKFTAWAVVAKPGAPMGAQHPRHGRTRICIAVGIIVGYLHGCDPDARA